MLLGLARARNETAGSNPAGRLTRGVQQTALVADKRGRSSSSCHLFLNQSGAPMTRYVARDRVKAVLKAAGVTVLPPQALRRTFVDNADRQGVALRTIGEMVGHETPAVTERSYMAAGRAEAARVERNMRVIQGGMR